MHTLHIGIDMNFIIDYYDILLYTQYIMIRQKPSKHSVLKKIEDLIRQNPTLRILDVGCGQARNFIPLIEKYPSMQYTGIEPIVSEYNIAKNSLSRFQNVQIINDLAYETNVESSFDIVVSLSVLEHVKHLDLFLAFAAKYTKPGGINIHLYDLGHALYPSSFQERLHVLACRLPVVSHCIPERMFTSYVNLESVKNLCTQNNMQIEDITYHNCRNHVTALKNMKNTVNEHDILNHICSIEQELSANFAGSQLQKEYYNSVNSRF